MNHNICIKREKKAARNSTMDAMHQVSMIVVYSFGEWKDHKRTKIPRCLNIILFYLNVLINNP